MLSSGVWCDLGRVEYGQALALQHRLVDARSKNLIDDVLLLCEHPDVITVGRRLSALDHVLSNEFPIHHVERGGDATYHGPGQLVGYPIFFFPEHQRDPHAILRGLEQALIDVCGALGVPAARKAGYTGVWTQDQQRKIASIGVALRHGVTFHGFALNVSTQLDAFFALRPCGLDPGVMTSLCNELPAGSSVLLSEVTSHAVGAVEHTFGRTLAPCTVDLLQPGFGR